MAFLFVLLLADLCLLGMAHSTSGTGRRAFVVLGCIVALPQAAVVMFVLARIGHALWVGTHV